jgi:hypothetical protein
MISTDPGLGQAVAVYRLEPDGLLLTNPVTIKVKADVSNLNQNRRDRLGLYEWSHINEKFLLVQDAESSIIWDPPGTLVKTCTIDRPKSSVAAFWAIFSFSAQTPQI